MPDVGKDKDADLGFCQDGMDPDQIKEASLSSIVAFSKRGLDCFMMNPRMRVRK